MLLTFEPDHATIRTLVHEGWILQHVPRITNPYDDRGEMTRQTFSMLWAYNISFLEKLVYIDVDFIALANIDSLFDCGIWCAVTSQRESQSGRFNGGLQVITPGADVYNYLMNQARTKASSSYNRGVQGFLNEALTKWCSHGEVNDWATFQRMAGTDDAKTKNLTKNWRACVRLSESYNHIAVIHNYDHWGSNKLPHFAWWPPRTPIDELYSKHFVQALHFNNPNWWCVKPWNWFFYPALPSNWIWWQHRRMVQGEARKAHLIIVGCAVVSWFASFVYLVRGIPRISQNEDSNQGCVRVAWWSCRVLRIAVCSVGIFGLVFLFFPSTMDALAAWTCYYIMKGTMLGILAEVAIAPACKPYNCARRLLSVLCGNLCVVIEAFIEWLPQMSGVGWVSTLSVPPLCERFFAEDSWQRFVWSWVGCNAALLILVIFDVLLWLSFQLILFACLVPSTSRSPKIQHVV